MSLIFRGRMKLLAIGCPRNIVFRSIPEIGVTIVIEWTIQDLLSPVLRRMFMFSVTWWRRRRQQQQQQQQQ